MHSCARRYVHRIGRTGRAGAAGESLTLLGPKCLELGAARDLVPILREAGQEVPAELERIAHRRAAHRRDGRGAGAAYHGHMRFGSGRRGGGVARDGFDRHERSGARYGGRRGSRQHYGGDAGRGGYDGGGQRGSRREREASDGDSGGYGRRRAVAGADGVW